MQRVVFFVHAIKVQPSTSYIVKFQAKLNDDHSSLFSLKLLWSNNKILLVCINIIGKQIREKVLKPKMLALSLATLIFSLLYPNQHHEQWRGTKGLKKHYNLYFEM